MSSLDKPLYWRSPEEALASDEPGANPWAGREFPEGATASPLEGLDEPGRRDFLKVLGVSLGAAGLAGCMRNPPERILPYTTNPADVRPGIPLHFASALSVGGAATPVLVTSREGRPVKIEGNPDHPHNQGSTTTLDQAQVWQLYDPQRAKLAKKSYEPIARSQLWKELRKRREGWKADGGEKLRFLVEPTTSPSLKGLREQILADYPKAKFYAWHPLHRDAVYEGTRIFFGRPLEPQHDFDKARVVVSFDADFLAHGPNRLRDARTFADHRVPENGMNRLYVIEPRHSLTGGHADHRFAMRGDKVLAFAAALLAEVAPDRAALVGAHAGPFKGDKRVAAVARDLKKDGKAGVVLAGERQPALVHAICAAINAAIGSESVSYTEPVVSDVEQGVDGLVKLFAEIEAGAVETLVVTAYNPVYTAPADLPTAQMLKKVPNVIYLGAYEDETWAWARWFLPKTHSLEEWGDVRTPDGVVALVQPLIRPLFNGCQESELYAAFLDRAAEGPYQLVKSFWRGKASALEALVFDKWWEKTVQKGIVSAEVAPPLAPVAVEAGWDVLGEAVKGLAPAQASGTELNFIPCYKLYDGRFADNAWLQELADPMTKMTWGNALLVSPRMAKTLGLKSTSVDGDMVEVTLDGRKMTLAAYVMPGHADDSATVALGYGRTGAEIISNQAYGANAYALRSAKGQWFAAGATITRVGKKQKLSVTQEHWSMEGRPLALDVEVGDITSKKHLPVLHAQQVKHESMYKDYEYPGLKWAMGIDMSRCVGCNACITACESENNILVVGPEEVRRGREMAWIRIDRWYKGDVEAESPEVVMQPVACVHCENAPCEYVCPVNATVHSDEGLNEMVYNRCIGTRYCSNNCPYKVRRFNYLNWHDNLQGTVEMAMNPDVTVRSRGVMEKCTYCVQRIEQKRIETRVEGREIKDGDIKTACQQVCPSRAIVFGTLSDEKAEVSRWHRDERAYKLLNELNTRPRTLHLARVRNPNPELA
jgi:molybdopterin-containing oxidoreductase family iron-sulfur binding subunit